MKRWLVVLAACGSGKPAVVPTGAGTGSGSGFGAGTEIELVEPNIISSPYVEIRLATSPDGATRLWGSTDRPGGPKGWNIWMSRKSGKSGDRWSEPVAVSFNSDANDFDPAYSHDGRFVYFFSNRPGGIGGDDIYRVQVTGDGFGAVEHLGPEINTVGDEWAPAPSPDGSSLMFASNVPGKKHDLYLSKITGSSFAKAELLPGAINTDDHDELDATFLADGTSIVFSRSTDVDNDPIALFVARKGASGYDAGTELTSVNVAGGAAMGPSISVSEPGVLYFSSKRTGASVGKLDIYRIRSIK